MNIEMADILIAKDFDNVFVIDPPTELENYILITNTGGFGVQEGRSDMAEPTVQIKIASKSYVECMENIRRLMKTLHGMDYKDISQILSSGTNGLVGFKLLSGILELGRDEQMRYIMAVNYHLYQNIGG